jgi:hypothetical protein
VSGRRSPLAWSVAALLTVALAGCGHVASVASSGTLQISLNEYRVTPPNVRVAAGSLTIQAHNYGRLTHDLVITEDGHAVASTQPIPPGQTAYLVTTLTHGRYLMASQIVSDQALGLYGTLHVH